jgi:poly(glycerol-phosphate) alpha-glucosyltransferase
VSGAPPPVRAGAAGPDVAVPRVALLTPWLGRRGGGVAVAVRSLARSLRAAGVGVSLHALAEEGDGGAEGASPGGDDPPVRLHRRLGPEALGFAPRMRHALSAEGPDLVHVHGLWTYPSRASLTWSRRSARPVVISPHGMLDPWALARSRWKKRVAGFLYETAHLRRGACLHALCRAEAEALRSYGLGNPIAVIPNGVDLPEAMPEVRPDWCMDGMEGRRALLFLGRLHPKKGLVQLLQAWAAVTRGAPGRGEADAWCLVIAGWDQGGHLGELQGLARDLGIAAGVRFAGPQFGPAKRATLAHADAFVLPSLSEGLPMAVLEAWSYGLPVIMTPQCNLPEGFEHGAAVRAEPDPRGLAASIHGLLRMPEGERRGMGDRGRRLVERRFSWPRIGREMRRVYEWVLGDAPMPACVLLD